MAEFAVGCYDALPVDRRVAEGTPVGVGHVVPFADDSQLLQMRFLVCHSH